MSSPRSHSTITVPPEIQRAAADILITYPPTTAFTHLEDIQSDKYLGVVLDNRLSFNKHTDEIAKKTNYLNLCRSNLHMCHQNVTSDLTHDIHHRLKWIPLQHRRALYDLAFFHKIRSNMININFQPIVQYNNPRAT